MQITEKAHKLQDQIVKWRRDLHQIPEVGLDLPKTAEYVTNVLDELGIEYQTEVGGSGIVALIRGQEDGSTIALRADMDGLAIKEETGLPFASQNDNMHACGHDAHTAMLLGAAKILQENRDKFSGNVKLLFQAAEEGPGGAKPMIEQGALENPKVEAVLGLHIGTISKDVGNGQVGLGYGKIMACLDRFEATIKGQGCHGAQPHSGVDPVAIAGQAIGYIQNIVSREVSPTNPAVVTIGKINGGRAYNIIPDEVTIEGTARATDQQEREKIATRLDEMFKHVVYGMRGDYEFKYHFGYPPLETDPEFTNNFKKTCEKVIGSENIKEMEKPTMGGEDMAYFLREVPGTFFFLGAGNREKGITYPHHNSRFDVDEDVFWKGTALMTQGALDWLE